MTKIMSPSEVNPITSGQIAKFLDLQTAALRKSGLPSELTQQVLESQGGVLANEFVALIRTRVEVMSEIIVRHVTVNRNRTPKQALGATNRNQYVTDSVVTEMPRGEGDGADVYFFKLDRYISDSDLDKEYELRGLKPADPYSQAAVNEADPAFADNHPNGTHWKDDKGNWCYSAFHRWHGARRVDVLRFGHDWHGHWWFAGLRK